MGQILLEDKIGALSHSSGVITLAASRLTIGGQQYETSSLNRTIATDVTLIANSLYMIYAVLSGGVVSLRISTNVNSVGPAGFTIWKLVGAFYANGTTSPAFGDFVNIEGVPETGPILFTPTGTFTNTTYTGKWKRKGDKVEHIVVATANGAVTGTFNLNMPTLQQIDVSKYTGAGSTPYVGVMRTQDSGVREYPPGLIRITGASSVDARFITDLSNTLAVTNVAPLTYGTGDFVEATYTYFVSGWTNTPLKDL